MGEFWVVFADMIRAGLNVDEPLPKLPPDDLELIPLVRSHRAPKPPAPTSLVPPEVARETEVRSIPLRSLAWLQGVKR